jgi:sortase system peptidoglycan-associated protein
MKKTLLVLTLVATTTSGAVFANAATAKSERNNAKPLLIGAGSGALLGGAIAGPPGAAIGAVFGLFIGQDHNDQEEITQLNASLLTTQQQLEEGSDALLAANRSLKQYQKALSIADESLRQAKLAELVTQIQFKTGESVISPVFYPHLDNLVKLMNSDPSLQLDIQGYADIRGNKAYNQALSEQRALAIKEYLLQSGINTARLSHSALGETASKGSNVEEHFFDRKAVITLSSNEQVITVKR